jgi:hypothetical protein
MRRANGGATIGAVGEAKREELVPGLDEVVVACHEKTGEQRTIRSAQFGDG